MNNILYFANMFKQNPMALLMSRFNLPQNMNNPQEIVQYLLNSGQVTQEQVNRAMSMKNDPMFKGLF